MVKVRRYDAAAGTWSASTTLSAEGVNVEAKIAADDSGNAVAVWESRDSENVGHVYATYYDVVEDSWTDAVRLDAEPADIGRLSLAMGADGAAHAVWVQSVNDKWSIVLATRPDP